VIGRVEQHLRNEIGKYGTICLALIDSEEISTKNISEIAKKAELCGVSGILVGGSTAIDQLELASVVNAVKSSVKIPVILFPGNVTGVSPNADAVLFTSLLNSDSTYFITEAQALGALMVKKYNIEAIPVGYIVIGEGGAAGFIGHARGIPPQRPTLAVMYALAAQYMGMRFVYLEAGSGVTSHVSSRMVKAVCDAFDGLVIVGGGLTAVEDTKQIAEAGADILVIGTLLETGDFQDRLKEIVNNARRPK